METITTSTNATLFFTIKFNGKGSWYILCDVDFKNESKLFSHYTADSNFVDQLSNLKEDGASFEEIQSAYYERYYNSFETEIAIWCNKITTEQI